MTASTSLHSNAFNFLSHVETGTDPRTGQYTCTISLPALKANDLCGPDVPVQLRFSPLNNTDSGLGLGWDLQLSQYNPVSQILSLSTGETFKVTGSGLEPAIGEKKLDSFHFFNDGGGEFRVVHKSGLVELLTVGGVDRIALPSQMRSAQGHRVNLSYINYGDNRLLSAIDNADGTRLLSLERQTDNVRLLLHPGSACEALFAMRLQDRRVTRIELPTDNQASWRFDYQLQPDGALRIIEVQTPVGGVETLTYAQIPHYFPGVEGRTLARVDTHRNDPGFGQPVIETRYTYSQDHHNFLGYGSNVVWLDDGMDNLYRAPDSYLYGSTESLWDSNSDSAIRSISRTFNRFHLLTVEETRQNDNVLRNETVFHLQPGKDFASQPAYCQLPHTATQTWYSRKDPSHKRMETVTTTYDDFGNLLTQVNANGVTETSSWYKAEGEDGCPPDPHKFVRNLKHKTITPAPSEFGQAPVLQTRYTYTEQLGLTGNGPWLAVGVETLVQGPGRNEQELQRTAFTYVNEPDNPFMHGRKSQDAVTLNGQTTTTAYLYSKTRHARSGEQVQDTVTTLTGFDGEKKVVTLQHSLIHGAPLLNRDDSDVEIAYRYDLLGRINQEIVAPDTPNQAIRSYTYKLSSAKGQQAEQTVTDVKGVQTRSLVDGLNRVVHEELKGSDPCDPERVVRTYSARYNARGQLNQDTVYDWWELDGQLDERGLTTRYRYDDWGQQRSVTGADGVARITEYDPIELEERSWIESDDSPPRISGMSLKKTNLFEKPLKIQQLDPQQKPVSEREFFYDGLGNCIEQYDEMGELTCFEYDPWSRLLTTLLPDGTQVQQNYATHSRATLPINLKIVSSNSSEDPVLAGEQIFDGLSRLDTLKVGPRSQRYEYRPGELQAHKHITANGKEIRYEYQLGLTDRPVGIVAEDEQASFTYDTDSAQLLKSENSQGRSEFDYDKTGRLLGERRFEAGNCWETRYTSSPRGRQVTRADKEGLTTTYKYDRQGRVEWVCQGQLHAQFSYNSLGQLQSTRSQDLAADTTLLTELDYDEHGREIQRTLTLTGHPQQTLHQTYRADSKLSTRHLREDNRSLLLETCIYDSRGRLQLYSCSGESLPKDRYGNGIVEELFAFDALDNITHVWRTFEDGSTDEATSEFAQSDRCQLVKVTHTHEDYLKEFPDGVELSYDKDGHLERDERGHYLNYDTQGRLLGVTSITFDPISRFRYDGHNQLLGVKHGTEVETLRFYQDDRLSSTRQGGTHINYFYNDEQLLGQQTVGDDGQTLLLLTDTKSSVIGESQGGTLRTAVYDPYGERHGAEPMQSLLAFNGEIRDEVNDWYLLGNGYRAYNPHLRRFHSPDSFSPFGAGGVNPYVYCASDPINFVDPTGHEALRQYNYITRPRSAGAMAWIGVMIGVGFTIASLGTLAPAGAAIAAGAGAATVAAGMLTITSFAAGAASSVIGVAAIVTGDEKLESATSILGYVALGTGLGAFGIRSFGPSGAKAAAATSADEVVSESSMKIPRAHLTNTSSSSPPGKSTFADDLFSGNAGKIPTARIGSPGSSEPIWMTDVLGRFPNFKSAVTYPEQNLPGLGSILAPSRFDYTPRVPTSFKRFDTPLYGESGNNPRDLALAMLY